MSEMEKSVLESRKKGHEAITAVISELERIGYTIKSVRFEWGALEVVRYPPTQDDPPGRLALLGEKAGTSVSMDGVSETFT